VLLKRPLPLLIGERQREQVLLPRERAKRQQTVDVGRVRSLDVTSKRDTARSYEHIDDADLERLGRVVDADLEAFFARNPRLLGWRDRITAVALAQGAAEHRLRGERGIWDFDLIVCFADTPALPNLMRRQVTTWDWGPSKFGRCPYDPSEYTGRAVDVKLWVIPDAPDPAEGLRSWLDQRADKHRHPARKPDVAHEAVVLIRPRLGEVVWDPGLAPPPKTHSAGHRRPQGLAPP
jgi:hypothetical protein